MCALHLRAEHAICTNNTTFDERYRVDLIKNAATVMGECVDFGKQLKAFALAVTFGG